MSSLGSIPDERRALVTGGGTGIGFAVARRLLKRGVAVMICGRREDVLSKACSELAEETGGRCEQVSVDLMDAGAPEAAVGACVEAFGGIDTLVNNAGIVEFCEFDAMTAESWERSDRAMARAPMLAMQAAARQMREIGFGRIVSVSSICADISEPESAQYSAAKAALLSLTRTAAVDLARFGITANAVSPGWVATTLVEEFLDDVGEDGYDMINVVRRAGEPDEIATVVEFLALDAPEFLTGETINVDGGHSIFLPLPPKKTA